MTRQEEKIFINGNFITMDKECPRADYVIVKDGIIKEVGKGPVTISPQNHGSVVDLDGKTVLPGFTDCHMHLMSLMCKKEREVDLSGVGSIPELKERVRDFIVQKGLKPGEWVVGSGWNNEDFPGGVLPDRAVLDSISSVHPMKLTRACYHLCSVNSLALQLAGIGRETPGAGVEGMDRDDKGYPTGVLRENAIEAVNRCIPGIEDKELMKQLILRGCILLAGEGITTVHTDDFGHVRDKGSLLEAYMELDMEGRLPIRVVLQFRVTKPRDIDAYRDLGVRLGKTLRRLTFGPVKIIADGSLGARTAALSEPYSDCPGDRGIMIYEKGILDEMISKAFDAGFDVAVHAIGDRAYETVLDLFEKHKGVIDAKGLRPSVIHCQVGSRRILEKMKALDVTANIQPVFINSDWRMAESRVGKERLGYSYCWRKYMDMGIRCVGSSDAPVEPFAPLKGIYSAVTRKDLKGEPAGGWMAEEGLALDEAIKLFTVNPSYLTRREGSSGKIAKGCPTDMVVLSEDIFSVPRDRIKDIGVVRAIVDGQETFWQGNDI